jgi:tryptophan-rich sensory protein
MKTVVVYALFTALIYAVGFSSALVSPPGEWYASLAKPWFTPPGWLFPIAWTMLYFLIGLAGGRALLSANPVVPTALWFAQLLLNGSWSIVFFRWHQPLLALVVLFIMLGAIVFFIVETWRSARAAALLFLPYAAWVSFAALVNGGVVVLN